MGARRQVSADPERPRRPWLLAAVLAVLLWPALLAPAHRHTGAPELARAPTVAAAIQLAQRADGSQPRDSDPCPVCRELLQTAVYLGPPAGIALATPPATRPEPVLLAPAALPNRTQVAWHSRAPPSPLRP